MQRNMRILKILVDAWNYTERWVVNLRNTVEYLVIKLNKARKFKSTAARVAGIIAVYNIALDCPSEVTNEFIYEAGKEEIQWISRLRYL